MNLPTGLIALLMIATLAIPAFAQTQARPRPNEDTSHLAIRLNRDDETAHSAESEAEPVLGLPALPRERVREDE